MISAIKLRHMGSDLDVVNNARVSFLKTSEVDEVTGGLKESDKRLIRFLARGMTEAEYLDLVTDLPFVNSAKALEKYRNTPTHWAPFANGNRITFHVKAPIPIMRQLFKHKIGAEEDEVSRRYINSEPEFFYPEFRASAENVKQGSGEKHKGDIWFEDDLSCGNFSLDALYAEHVRNAVYLYNQMIKGGVCPEQARFALPQGMMTEAIISHSLYGWANAFIQRTDSHAQKEIQDLLHDIGRQIAPLFPVSWEALTGQVAPEAPLPPEAQGGPLAVVSGPTAWQEVPGWGYYEN